MYFQKFDGISLTDLNGAKLAFNYKPPRNCNCEVSEECPLNGQCLTDNLIYHSTLTPEIGPVETYVGLTCNTFKTRWSGHKTTFKHEKYSKDTTLSQHVWKLKKEGINFELKWKVIARAAPFSPVTALCQLCTTEKYLITFEPKLGSLNVRNELAAHCRHKRRVLLDNT